MKKWFFIGLCLLALSGCHRPEKFSEVPHIEFISIEKEDDGTGTDNQALLTIHFQDGDGDIGLRESDTVGVFSKDSLFYYNFFIDFYEKQHGQWVKVDLSTPLHARVPYLSENVPESIQGELSILTYINNYNSSFDTVKLSCHIVDRALHVSNSVETPEIIVNK